jgi:hypothetical protein
MAAGTHFAKQLTCIVVQLNSLNPIKTSSTAYDDDDDDNTMILIATVTMAIYHGCHDAVMVQTSTSLNLI